MDRTRGGERVKRREWPGSSCGLRCCYPGSPKHYAPSVVDGRDTPTAVRPIWRPKLAEILDGCFLHVMAGLVPAIHVFDPVVKTWMVGPSPAMTAKKLQF